MSTVVREALRTDRRRISTSLSLAFEDDPVSAFIFRRDRGRRSRLVSFYRIVLDMMSEHGAVYTDRRVRGAAVWRAPSPPPVASLKATREGLRMLATLRSATGRALALDQIVSQARPVEPHWYLAILGTEPSEQGRGIGSALLAPVLARCDDERMLAYLESSKAENLPFYERHGFRVAEELRVPGGPTLWAMSRQPRVARP
jgi:GNAT superfamily N-acetyltransferase